MIRQKGKMLVTRIYHALCLTIALSLVLLLPLLAVGSACGGKPQFTLTSWEVVDEDQKATLEIQFTAGESINLHLIDPAGYEVDNTFIFKGTATRTRLHMVQNPGITPVTGQYRLVVADAASEPFASEVLEFNGPELSISAGSFIWKISDTIRCNLEVAGFKVKNGGDLPAYVNGEISILDKYGYATKRHLSPFTVPVTDGAGFSVGDSVGYSSIGGLIMASVKGFNLELRDSNGQILCSYSSEFKGAGIVISEVTGTWKEVGGGFDLEGIKMKLTNTGDLPASIRRFNISLDGKTGTIDRGAAIGLLPGEERDMDQFISLSRITPGTKTLAIELQDPWDEVIGSFSVSVTP